MVPTCSSIGPDEFDLSHILYNDEVEPCIHFGLQNENRKLKLKMCSCSSMDHLVKIPFTKLAYINQYHESALAPLSPLSQTKRGRYQPWKHVKADRS